MSRAAADQLNQPQHMNNYTRPNGQNVKLSCLTDPLS